METIIINDDRLSEEDIDKTKNKVRAILLTCANNKLLVSNYNGVILLPGGSVDKGETSNEAIIRELKEETGIIYDIDKLHELFTINHYQYKYLTSDDKIMNRLIITKYYLGLFKGVDINNIKITENEKKGNFYTELMKIDDLYLSTLYDSLNPRKKYFDRENKEIIKVLRKNNIMR